MGMGQPVNPLIQPNPTLNFTQLNYVWVQPEPTHSNPLVFGSGNGFEVLNPRTQPIDMSHYFYFIYKLSSIIITMHMFF